MNYLRREALIFGLLLAVGCLVWLWPLASHPGSPPYWSGSEYTDLLVSHYPNAVIVHTGLESYHQVPLWNPLILGGTPANADPLVGLWYPPRWLSFLFPSIWVFNLLAWLHLVVAGAGAFQLARLEGASKASAMVGGIVMAGLPKLMTHLALGHIDLVFAISWTPWAVLALKETLLRIGKGKPMLASSVMLGLAGGVIFLADPRWLIPVVLMLIAYAIPSIWRLMQESRTRGEIIGRATGAAAIGSLAAALVAAPLALPLIQYTALSTRRQLLVGDQSLFSLPPLRLTGLAMPFNDVPEWFGYVGLPLLILFMAGNLLRSRPARRWGFISLLFLLLALGYGTPIYSLLAALPGFDLLRVPARYMALVGLAMCIGGAHALDELQEKSQPAEIVKRLNLSTVSIVATAIGLAVLIFRGQDAGWMSVMQVVLSGVGALGLILARQWLRTSSRIYAALWLALISLDLLWMNSMILEVRPTDWESSPAWMEEIDPGNWGQWRIFSPSYSLGQDQAARNQLEMVDGVHPLQLSSYYEYVAEATGFDATRYSVTLPPFPDSDPSNAWDVILDTQQLGKLNVKYVLSDYSLSAQGLALILDQDSFLYENQHYYPRAWVEPLAAAQQWLPIEQLVWSPNRIIIQAIGPGLLVVSEVDYPGWVAKVNDEPVEIIAYDGLLRSVYLADGVNRVEFVYQPVLTWVGLGGWVAMILSLVILRLKWWK